MLKEVGGKVKVELGGRGQKKCNVKKMKVVTVSESASAGSRTACTARRQTRVRCGENSHRANTELVL